jgi:hypothetical protein
MKTFLLLPVFAVFAAAQPVGAGLKLGLTLTDAISFQAPITQSPNFVVGPYVEVRLPKGFAIEGDALYLSGIYSGVATGGSSWEFPVMAKYKFRSGIFRPYVEGGVAVSHLTDLKNVVEVNHKSNFGVVLGAGLEVHVLFLRIMPEVRYDGFLLRNVESPGVFQSNKNQALFLVGFGF